MPRCVRCQKSGWFLTVNSKGVCENCGQALILESETTIRVVEESYRIATKTKNIDTMLSRLAVAENRAMDLMGVAELIEISPHPESVIETIASAREQLVVAWIDRELLSARSKSTTATTPAGKIRGYSKLLEKIAMINDQVEPDIAEQIKEKSLLIRKEFDGARFKIEMEKADKLEFRGQKKCACDAYIDALYLLYNDSILDEDQKREMEYVKSKIEELGGEVPVRKK